MFWLIGTAFALPHFLTVTALEGFARVFREIAISLFLEGSGDLEKTWAPNRQKHLTRKKSKNIGKIYFLYVSSSKKGRFFFSFLSLGAPHRGRAAH